MTELKRGMDVVKDSNNNERAVNDKKTFDGVKEKSLNTRDLYATGHGVHLERNQLKSRPRIQA